MTMDRNIVAGRLMLRGLGDHLCESVRKGRIEAWRKCAHVLVDYIADSSVQPDNSWLDWISKNHQARL